VPQGLLALTGWSLFAFAGAYRWTLVPVMAAALVAVWRVRPRVGTGPHRLFDTLVLISVTGVAAQLVPLPAAVRQLVSPETERARDALLVGGGRPTFEALSLDPQATAWSLATAVTVLLVFWIARDTFERGGIRQVCRGIAWFGLVLAAIVFVQHAVSPRHIYGFWAPITRTSVPTPFGPYVNRNDFAAWLLLAIPLVVGYGIARMASRAGGRRGTAVIESVLDARAILLSGAVVLMTAALVASLSRSGLAGIGAGLCLLGLLGRRRLGAAGTGAFALGMAALLLLSTQYTNMTALAFRLGDALPEDVGGRMTIWRETWPMARDFLGVGIGVGAFERGMLVYQQSSRLLFFNHAHNEYLQVLAEGGLLVSLPAAAAILTGGWLAWRRLHRDETSLFWIRAGAVSGAVGIGIQSVWDTALRMPANGVLFAIVAAIALHSHPRAGASAARETGRTPGAPLRWPGRSEAPREPPLAGRGPSES
jgi:O-antigen ligase